MEIILEVVGSDEFSVEVGPFDTAFNVKETVQKLHHIPIFLQNFFFNGQLIHDHLYIWTSQIFDGSRIQLVIAPSVSMPSQQLQPELPPLPPLPTVPSDNDDYIPFWQQPEIPQLIPTPFVSSQFLMTEFPPSTHVPSNRTDKPPSPPQPPPPRVTLNFKVPNSNYRIPIEAELNDTVLHLKEKIVAREEIMPGVPVERIVLESAWTRMMLFDNQILKDSAVSINGEIDVFVKPSPPVAGEEKVKVKVLPMLAREKIEIEVSVSDNVAVLREELNKLHRTLRFRLPLPEDGGYFFIHRKWVMHEEKSFQWHGVSDGDTIETFDGCAREYDDASSSTSSSKPSLKRQR